MDKDTFAEFRKVYQLLTIVNALVFCLIAILHCCKSAEAQILVDGKPIAEYRAEANKELRKQFRAVYQARHQVWLNQERNMELANCKQGSRTKRYVWETCGINWPHHWHRTRRLYECVVRYDGIQYYEEHRICYCCWCKKRIYKLEHRQKMGQ